MNHKNFIDEDIIKSKLTYNELYKRIRPYLKKHLLRLIVLLAMVILMAVISRMIPTLIGYTVDHALVKKDQELLIKLLGVYIALEFTSAILDLLQIYFFQKLGARILYDIREDLITKIQSYPIDYFSKNPIGRIVTRATNDVAQIGEIFSNGVISIFVQAVILISIMVSLFLISFKIAICTLITFPIFYYLSIKLSDRTKETLRESKKKLSQLNSFVAENLYGIKIVQLYNRINKNRELFQKQSGEYKELSLQSTKNYAMMMPVMNLLNAVIITSAFYFSGQWGAKEGLAVGSMVAFFLHALDIVHPFREILEKYQQFQNSLTSAERVFTMLDEPSESNEDVISEPVKQIIQGKFIPQIEFRNLSFQYQKNLDFVLKNINLLITPGESVAIIGRTGSGKSTLINLLQGFYKAPQQSLFLSNVAIEEIPKKWLRQKLSVVQQDNFLFKGNILQNITLESMDISEEKVKKIAHELGLLEHLQQTHRDLNSPVEEKGANLSAGERQLIAFARILAFDPEIIILDEATSNIDSKTEKLIQQATERITENRTSIIIAHRLSTIRNCQKIILMEYGEIKAQGSHQDLMNSSSQYRELIEKYNSVEEQ